MRTGTWLVSLVALLAAGSPLAAQDYADEPITRDAGPAPLEVIPIPPSTPQDDEAGEVEESEEPVFGDELEEAMAELGEEMPDFGSMFGDAFKPEPLTPEQEARLPTAGRVVDRIFPNGTYARMVDSTLAPMMEGLMGSEIGTPRGEVACLLGMDEDDLDDLDDEQVAAAVGILDPVNAERAAATTKMMLEMVSSLLDAIEPAYRTGLTRAYAKRFDESEMDAMVAFFDTPAGQHYAAESMLIYADPEVMAAMNEMGPAMMAVMPDLIRGMGKIAEDFPEARKFGELNEAERARLSDLLGVGQAELESLQPDQDDDGDDGEYEDGSFLES
ncbi:DUF2059 domain-containing protein [Erythrobacter sp. 3-20A1M]|nr:DUF2059 domain-containing protein [Erythrobacter sp. 3-20A1M]